MASVIKPDGDLLHIFGAVKTSVESNLGKLNIDNASDVDLNNLPADHASADAALNVQGGAVIGGHLYTAGTFVAGGDVITLGSGGGSLSLNANINSNVLPATTESFNIGSSTNVWDKIYVDTIITPTFGNTTTSSASLTVGTDMLQTGTPAAVSLADGEDGQEKKFIVISAPANPVVLTPATPLGFASITFTTIGESATLMYKNSSGWCVMAVNRASVTL
jgi:hypothetical protein